MRTLLTASFLAFTVACRSAIALEMPPGAVAAINDDLARYVGQCVLVDGRGVFVSELLSQPQGQYPFPGQPEPPPQQSVGYVEWLLYQFDQDNNWGPLPRETLSQISPADQANGVTERYAVRFGVRAKRYYAPRTGTWSDWRSDPQTPIDPDTMFGFWTVEHRQGTWSVNGHPFENNPLRPVSCQNVPG